MKVDTQVLLESYYSDYMNEYNNFIKEGESHE